MERSSSKPKVQGSNPDWGGETCYFVNGLEFIHIFDVPGAYLLTIFGQVEVPLDWPWHHELFALIAFLFTLSL